MARVSDFFLKESKSENLFFLLLDRVKVREVWLV